MRLDYVCPVVGKRRSGKSTLLHGDPTDPDVPDWGIVDWSAYARCFIVDPREEWTRGLMFERFRHFKRALLRAAHGDFAADRKRWVYRPRDGAVKEWFKLLAPKTGMGGPMKKGVPGLIVIDEASEYQSSHSIPEGLARIVDLGGNADQSVVLAVRHWKSLNVNIRTQRDVIVGFRGVRRDVIMKDWKRLDRNAPACLNLTGHQFGVLGERELTGWIDAAEDLSNFADLSQFQDSDGT